MSDDARPLIDNPYRASHTPIYVGDVNVTDLMARAWDRGFAAGDERLRAMLGKVPREQLGRIMQEVAATPNAPKADVRRWTPAYGPNGSCCYENENGDYVLARDYDDLAAASPDERLREALREIVAAFPPTPDREMDEEETAGDGVHPRGGSEEEADEEDWGREVVSPFVGSTLYE